jgi:hypothetical protein
MRTKIISRVMSEMGRKGGKIGGKRSLETMTPEQRSERARKASAARWAKTEHIATRKALPGSHA